MSGIDFLLLATILVAASIVVGFLAHPRAREEDRPGDEVHRWSVLRIYPERLWGGRKPAVEGLTGGPSLTAPAAAAGGESGPRLHTPDGKEVLRFRRSSGLRGIRLKVRAQGRWIGELRAGRGGRELPRIHALSGDYALAGDPEKLEIEVRRGGRLVALLSPAIAPRPGAVGVEILAGEEQLPLIGFAAGLLLLSETGTPVAEPGPPAPTA